MPHECSRLQALIDRHCAVTIISHRLGRIRSPSALRHARPHARGGDRWNRRRQEASRRVPGKAVAAKAGVRGLFSSTIIVDVDNGVRQPSKTRIVNKVAETPEHLKQLAEPNADLSVFRHRSETSSGPCRTAMAFRSPYPADRRLPQTPGQTPREGSWIKSIGPQSYDRGGRQLHEGDHALYAGHQSPAHLHRTPHPQVEGPIASNARIEGGATAAQYPSLGGSACGPGSSHGNPEAPAQLPWFFRYCSCSVWSVSSSAASRVRPADIVSIAAALCWKLRVQTLQAAFRWS